MGKDGNEDFARTFNELNFHMWTNDQRFMKSWFEVFLASGKELKKEDCSYSEVEIFFIKLFGILTEGKEHFRIFFLAPEIIDIINEQFPDRQINSQYKEEAEKFWTNFNSLAPLSSEDFEAIEYIRNRACHLQMNGYNKINTTSFKFEEMRLDKKTKKAEDKETLRNRIFIYIHNQGGIKEYALRLYNQYQKNINEMYLSIDSCLNRHGS